VAGSAGDDPRRTGNTHAQQGLREDAAVFGQARRDDVYTNL